MIESIEPKICLLVVALVSGCSSSAGEPSEPPASKTTVEFEGAPQVDTEAADVTDPVVSCAPVGAIVSDVSTEPVAETWSVDQDVGGVSLVLPKEPDTLELPDGSGHVIVSDEFGDAFGVLVGAGTSGNLSFALARALDRLFGVEWGEAPKPELSAASLTAAQAAFTGFGQDYVACWRRLEVDHSRVRDQLWLFAVVTPGREPLARAFIEGASVKGP